MKKLIYLFLILIVIVSIIQVDNINARSAQKDGAKLFVDMKCNSCHSVESFNIELKNKNSKAPDLSNIGSTRTPDFLFKYLRKEIEINGKKHGVSFIGNDSELGDLVCWMMTLRKV